MKTNEVYTDHEGFGFYTPGDQPGTNSPSLYNWVFHFNDYSGMWNAIPRDDYNEYWSNHKCERVLSSSSIDTLKELIYKTNGDKNRIEKLISE